MEKFIKLVYEYIECNLSDECKINDLKDFTCFLKKLNHRFTKQEYKEIMQNKKLKTIIENISKENDITIEEIDDILLLYIHENRSDEEFNKQKEIILKIKNGDKKAKNKFIQENQGLITKIAIRYADRGLDFDDLIQEGNIGLLEAINRFDPEKGFMFSTYAIWWIRSEIRKAVCTKAQAIRVPMYIEEKMTKYRVVRNELTRKLNREPSIEEIATCMEISLNELQFVLQTKYSLVSLDAPLKEDGETELYEILSSQESTPEDEFIKKELKKVTRELLDSCNLNEKQKFVLIKHYGIDGKGEKTLEEIGNMMNISRERVRQIEHKAIMKIRLSKAKEKVIDYVDNQDEKYNFTKRL